VSDWRADLLRRSYAAWAKQDAEALVAVWTPDCEWDMGPVAMAGFNSVYRGHSGLRAFVADAASVFDAISCRILEIREADEHVLVRASQEGHSRALDLQAAMRFGQIAEFHDGLIHRVVQTGDPPPAWADAVPITG
jgi:ketosteroid isomerase-like protein